MSSGVGELRGSGHARRSVLLVGLFATLILLSLFAWRPAETAAQTTPAWQAPSALLTAGVSSVTEVDPGDSQNYAVFYVTVRPIPAGNLDIHFSVSQEGNVWGGIGNIEQRATVTLNPFDAGNTRDRCKGTNGCRKIRVPIQRDDVHEADGWITVTLLRHSGDSGNTRYYNLSERYTKASIRVVDDDTPVVSLAQDQDVVTFKEGGSVARTVELSVDPAPYRPLTVRFRPTARLASPYSATAGDDFSTGELTATVAADASTATLTVPASLIRNDAISEDLEVFDLEIVNDASYQVGGKRELSVVIVDDEQELTVSQNPDGTFSVPGHWPLIPSGLGAGAEFRLLFITNNLRDATSPDIADYDAHVQAAASGGHPAIQAFESLFKVVGSTSSVDARDHTSMTGTGVPIYWMGGDRVARGYAGFWSNTWENWDSGDRRAETGEPVGSASDRHWTGTDTDGTKHASPLGPPSPARLGGYAPERPISHINANILIDNSLLGISPIFRVAEPPPRLVFNTRHLDVEEHSNCPAAFAPTISTFGASHKTVTYTVRLWSDPGGWARVTVFDPSDSRGVHHQYLTGYQRGVTVTGTGYTGPVTSRFNGTTDLWFGPSNWNVPQTVTVNIHCAQHDDDLSYEIWNRLQPPGGGDAWYRSTVKVFDTTSAAEPSNLAGNAYPGATLRGGPYNTMSWSVAGGREWRFSINWSWETSRHPNDWFDANKHFSGFLIKVEGDDSVSPPLPVQTYWERSDFVLDWDAFNNTAPYRLRIEHTGLPDDRNSATNPGDPVYRITVTPVTIRGNQVPGEALTFCVELYSPNQNWLRRKWHRTVDCASAFTLTAKQVVAATPSLTIASDVSSVTEGGDVTFTVTADPAPDLDTTVNLGVAEEMGEGLDYVGRGHAETLTLPAGDSTVTWTVTTYSDDVDRADGTVMGWIKPGDGYTVGAPSSVTLALVDDDPVVADQIVDGAPGDATPSYTVAPQVIAAVQELASQTHHGTAHVNRWQRALAAFGVLDPAGVAGGSLTLAEARQNANTYSSPVWDQVVTELEAKEAFEAAQQTPPPTPEVSITSASSGTEGQAVTFTVSANPAPAADLAVSATVATSGDYGVNAGARTVTITGGTTSKTLTLPTTDDSTDEADGSVTLTLNGGSGYTLGQVSSETVQVQDDDHPQQQVVIPVVSITAGSGVTEGGNASFMLTANPAPASPLSVSVTVSQVGDFGVTAGSRTVTVPTSGSVLLTVATTDDSTDEADGSVTATINTGDGYTVSSSQGAGTVGVSDDDDPPPVVIPVVSISGGAGVTEGGDAGFTITASPVPAADLTVSVTVSQSGDYGATTGSRTVTVPTSGSATLTVATVDDSTDEADGSVTVTLVDGVDYDLGTNQAATVAVSDDDEAAPMPVSTVTISIEDASASESASDLVFRVTLSEASNEDVTVQWATLNSQSPDRARGGQGYHYDYWHARGEIVIRAGETSGTGAVWLNQDSRDEPDEVFTVTLSSPQGATIERDEGTMTIIDDD